MQVFTFENVIALTLFPFIILKKERYKQDAQLLNHEKIHLQQQKELLVVGFYIWYLVEYGVRFLQHKNRWKAYRAIVFEREAYAKESQQDYLYNRKPFSFFSFYRRNK
jgi:hypothetical protein